MRRAATALLATLLLAPSLAPAGEGPITGEAAFERLKSLAGTWTCDGFEGQAPEVTYRVTAHGTAVVETLFAGQPHEMVTIYHRDGEGLRLIHYCAAGNQPRLVLDRDASTADELRFTFDGGTNLDPAKDTHMHEGRIRFAPDGKVESHWVGYVEGKPGDSVVLKMSRKP